MITKRLRLLDIFRVCSRLSERIQKSLCYCRRKEFGDENINNGLVSVFPFGSSWRISSPFPFEERLFCANYFPRERISGVVDQIYYNFSDILPVNT